MEEKNEFKRLSATKIKKLNDNELQKYKENLKEYYLNEPFDKQKHLKDEKNYLIFEKIIMPIFNFLYRPKVYNKDLIPPKAKIGEPGRLFISNHLDSLDHFSIISAIGKKNPIHPMASTTLLNLFRGKLYKKIGCVFVNLESAKSSIEGLEECTKLLVNGMDVLLFPEGTRNKTGKYMLKFTSGAARLAQESGCKVIPTAINDDYRLFKNTLSIRFGKPISSGPEKNSKEETEIYETIVRDLIYDNMEQNARETSTKVRQELIQKHQEKQKKLEIQRQKINKKR